MYIQVNEMLLMTTTLSQLDLHGTGACVSFNFRKTARAVTRLFDLALQESGIRSTQFTILVGIAKTQPTPVGALGNMLVIDSTTLTRSLRLLESKGLIAISKRSTMRQRFITLTPQGEQALAAALPQWRKVQGRFVEAVGSDYWTNLRCELVKLGGLAIELETLRQDASAAPVAP